MKFTKPLIYISIVALTLAATIGALSLAGIHPVKAITEARCDSGGVLSHSSQAAAVAADADGHAAGASDVPLATPKPTNRTNPTGANLIPNASLQASGPMPDGWQSNIYGSNNAKFSVVAGKDGDKTPALRVDITTYKDGDADWYYAPVNVTPGGYYTFQDSYRSSVTTRPVLMLHHKSGENEYINLKAAPASSAWTNYDITFFAPSDVNQVLVYHPLASVGSLLTSDYSLTATQSAGFSEPLVSITFDDGWKSIHDNALPLLKKYQMVSTQYLISGYLGRAADYMKPADVYDLIAAGNDIGSHTVDHLDLTKATPSVIKYELAQSKTELSKCFSTPTDYAAPYGTYNSATTQAASSLYQTARSTDVGFNTADNLNPYGLVVQNVATDTTEAQIQDWLETAKAHHAWLILVYHQIDSSGSHYARPTADFEQDLKSIKASNISVKTVHNAYQEVKDQTHK